MLSLPQAEQLLHFLDRCLVPPNFQGLMNSGFESNKITKMDARVQLLYAVVAPFSDSVTIPALPSTVIT